MAARMTHRLRQPWPPALVLAAAVACSAALAMVAAKLACVAVLVSGEIGRDQLLEELALLSVPGWFGADLLVGLVWGLALGGAFGLAARRFAPRGAMALLVLLSLALAVALAASVQVFVLFGIMPSWQLAQTLSQVGDATDSAAAMFDVWRIALLVVLATISVAGSFLFARLLRGSGSFRVRAPLAAAALVLICSVATVFSAPSRFELEKNPLLSFAATAAFGTAVDTPAPVAGQWAEILAPMAPDDTDYSEHELPAYKGLRQWARTTKPNVVLVIMESTAPKNMGVTGGAIPNTPTLSRIASEGLFWPNYFAHSPNSIFAIYQILCAQHGDPQTAMPTSARPRIDCGSLSEVFSENGYRAGLFHSGRFSYSNKDRLLVDRGYEVLFDAENMPHREDYTVQSWGIEERGTIDAMLTWIGKNDDPFFITYIPVYPHHPYRVPKPEYEQFNRPGKRGRYINAIYYFDQMVEYMLEKMGDVDHLDDTLFVFIGDHGEGFGEHPGSQAHGSKLYDETARTMAIWYAPGSKVAGYIDERPAGHVSLAPTILDLVNLRIPASYPMPSAAPPGRRPMVPLYTGYFRPLIGFVDGAFKVIVNRETDEAELFDLRRDPEELHNLADTHVRLVDAYRERVDAFLAGQKGWENSLTDLVPEIAEPPSSEFQRWRFRPADCQFKEGFLAREGENLRVRIRGKGTAKCEKELRPGRGAVVSFGVRGFEAISGSYMRANVFWVGRDGSRKELAYCALNGNRASPAHGCEAVIIGSRAHFAAGGKLVAELYFHQVQREPNAEYFILDEIEMAYWTDDALD